MDTKTALYHHRLQQLHQLSARCKTTEFEEEKSRRLLARTGMGVFAAKKGEKLNAYGHVVSESSKGTVKGMAPGVVAGSLAGLLLRKRLKVSGGKGAGIGALIGAGVGGSVGGSAGYMKGFYGKDADKYYMSADDRVIDFAYRDEYGRYSQSEEENKSKVGIGAGASVAALGAGLYARGRVKGTIGPSSLETYGRNRFAGLVARGREGINPARIADGTYNRSAIKDAGTGAMRYANDGVKHVGKVSRRGLRSMLLRSARFVGR